MIILNRTEYMCAEDRGDGKVQMTPCKKGIKPQVRN